jgi:AcrR family transcriptional regulator
MLIDAAEALLQEEGFVAVSARRVAERAGLKPQLVHYYFETMDDLMLAVVRRVNEGRRARHREVEASPRPLHALWEMMSDPSSAALSAEITSLAIHREPIRGEVARAASEIRELQAETLERLFVRYGVDIEANPPIGVILLMSAASRALMAEMAVGLMTGVPEALALVAQFLDRLEPPDRAP